MKHVVCWGLWNRVTKVVPILDSIEKYIPKDVEVWFIFDNCVDGSDVILNTHKEKLYGRRVFTMSTSWEIKEVGMHKLALEFAVLRGDIDVLTILQDDQSLTGPIVEPVNKLFETEKNIGVVGGRSGYDALDYVKARCAPWSPGAALPGNIKLKPGEWAKCILLNSGPVTYSIPAVKVVGYPDTEYVRVYIWDDYGVRCKEAGFQNYVIGTEVCHSVPDSGASKTYGKPGVIAHDLQRYHTKWDAVTAKY